MAKTELQYGRVIEEGTGNMFSVPFTQDLLILFESTKLTDALASAGIFWADLLHHRELTVPENIFDYLLQFYCSYVPTVA